MVPVQPFKIPRYHAVEEVTRGVRTSIALFSPRSWTRILPNSLSELADVGFFPPRSAMSTQLLDQIDNSDFNALPAEEDGWTGATPDSEDIIQLTMPTQEEEKEIQEWCVSEHVALPFNPLETPDGTIQPLTEKEEKELRDHINAGHLNKCHLCKGCLLSEGPASAPQSSGCRSGHACLAHRHYRSIQRILRRIPLLPRGSPQTPGLASLDRRAIAENEDIGDRWKSVQPCKR